MSRRSRVACVFIISLAAAGAALGAARSFKAGSADAFADRPVTAKPLTLDEVFTRIERSHPLLQGAGAERLIAKGRLLRALGAFEPAVVNDVEVERFLSKTGSNTRTAGFNDTFVDMRHPSGIRGIAGIRQSIGGATIPDLGFNDDRQQVLLGAFIPLLRGFLMSPENAELQRSQLAKPRAEVQIAQTRQDLFFGAANQYWDWVAAWKVVRIQQRMLAVAKDRLAQVRRRAKAGAAAPMDVTEAEQGVQRRTESLIAAQRKGEQEAFKLSLFLWEADQPVVPAAERVPAFPKATPPPSRAAASAEKQNAMTDRPEVRAVMIEAELNDIDLKLARNNLLPKLDFEAAPARSPEKFVLGLGYRFGVTLRVPLFRRQARGELTEATAKAQRYALMLKFREEQVATDVDNALSALARAKERIQAASRSLRLARTLLEGEQKRFELGATNVLFVNLRERNAVDAETRVIQARADYEKARAFYRWASGTWAVGTSDFARGSF